MKRKKEEVYKKKKTSNIWKYFEEREAYRAACLVCEGQNKKEVSYSFKGHVFTNMKQHLLDDHLIVVDKLTDLDHEIVKAARK